MRRWHDYTGRVPGIVEALEGLPCRSAVIDGEAVILGEDGVSDFFALHAALARRHAPAAQLAASISFIFAEPLLALALFR
jgi:bifunctional non-homologous end joining protein LigD